MSTTLGTLAATEQPLRYGWSPTRGIYTIRTWRGGRTQIDAVAAQLRALGYAYEVNDIPGDLAEIQATISGDETGGRGGGSDINNRWELVPNRVMKDLLESDNAMIRALSDENIENINYYLQNPMNLGTGGTVTSKFTNTGDRTNAVKAYKLMRAGVKGVIVSQPILRHTWSVPNNQNPGFAFDNIHRVLSTATLISNEGVPADFLLPLSTLPTKFTNPTRTDSVALSYGWWKAMPSLSVAAYNRREISAEWEFGLWSTDIYGAVL